MNNLQKALTSNAIFSTLSGLILLLGSQWVAIVFELEATLPFVIVGAALLFFAATIVVEIIKQRPKAVYWIIIQDMLWALGSLGVILAAPLELPIMANALIFIVAIIVLFFAIWQYKGLQRRIQEAE